MAEFQELIKNFDRIRDYMRQFYIYGFKVRNDFDSRSAGPMTMNGGGSRAGWAITPALPIRPRENRSISISTARQCPKIPLCGLEIESFTDNDILLHFSFWISSPIILGE